MVAATENILLIRLKSIGDVALTLPAVHVVRENFPAARITFLTSKENNVILQGFRDVNEIISLDRATFRTGNPFKIIPEMGGLAHRLRASGFTHVIDFQGYGETAWLTRLTGAPRRWGSVYRNGSKWAYTHGIPRDNKIQIVDFYLSMLRQCGLKIGPARNEFILPAEPLAIARNVFTQHHLDPLKPTLFIQAFTSSPHKNWPLENYLKVATHFRNAGHQIIFSGGPRDVAALEPAGKAGFVIAAGLPLMVAAGLVQLSTVTLGGATGLLHLAVALKKRVVMLVADPSIESGLPFQHPDWVIEPPRGSAISGLKYDSVATACKEALESEMITSQTIDKALESN